MYCYGFHPPPPPSRMGVTQTVSNWIGAMLNSVVSPSSRFEMPVIGAGLRVMNAIEIWSCMEFIGPKYMNSRSTENE